MRILIPGGSGQIGTILARHLHAAGHQVTVLSRTPKPAAWATQHWNGLTLDPTWTTLLDTTDAVIHLSGRSVNTRYTPAHRKEILDSRVLPTQLLGRAIEQSRNPPALWINASTATFYRNSTSEPQDEFTGELGGGPNAPPEPSSWQFSYEVARRWEEAFYSSTTPATRKVALRTSLTMSPDPGGVFSVLLRLVKLGLGGTQGPGTQFVSWMHDLDYCRATDFLLEHPEISGPVNFTVPEAIPNRDFMRILREAWGQPIGLPAFSWMLELGAIPMQTETELILKSRRAVPKVLLDHGFQFTYPDWPSAAQDLVQRSRNL